MIAAAAADAGQVRDDVDAMPPKLLRQVRFPTATTDAATSPHRHTTRSRLRSRSRSRPDRSTSTPTARPSRITTRRAVDPALDRQVGPVAVGRDVGQRGIDPHPIDDVARQATASRQRPARSCRAPRESRVPRTPRRTPGSTDATRRRRTATPAPALRCRGTRSSGKSRSSSSRRRNGSTLANDHWSFPSAAHPSKSAAVARTNTPALTVLEPPITLPRGTETTFDAVNLHVERPVGRVPFGRARPSPRHRADRTGSSVALDQIAAGLKQQDRTVGILAESRRQRAPGRAGADDDDVVVVVFTPNRS